MELLGFGVNYKDEICTMLESNRMFQEMTRAEIETLSEHMHAYRAEPGTIVLQEGHRDPYMYILIEGRLSVLKQDESEEQRKLAIISAGRTIGEMALIDGQPLSATVVVDQESTMLLLTREHLNTLSQAHPRVALSLMYRLAGLLSNRLRMTSGKLIDHL